MFTHRAPIITLMAFALAAPLGCTKKAPQRHASAGSTTTPAEPAPPTKPASPTPPEKLSPQDKAKLKEWRERGPLSPVMKASAEIVEAAKRALLKTPPSATPFAPMSGIVPRGLVQRVQSANPRELRMMGFEFELLFAAKDKPSEATFYLRTFMHTGEHGPQFFKIDGRVPTAHKLSVPTHPLSAYKGPVAQLFARGARGLATMLKTGRCQALPLVSPGPLKTIMHPGVRTMRMLANLRRARAGRDRLCAALSKLDLGSYRLRLDDISIAALGRDGRIKGMIRGELELREGRLHLKLLQYRSLVR
ncbi:MAG: hypothetical protein CSA24_01280 [Deltaproteobacteria bacterium]|nr:MAG: hypothetical protein CSA24_01280 [Deltaproteobacteria bacterium]